MKASREGKGEDERVVLGGERQQTTELGRHGHCPVAQAPNRVDLVDDRVHQPALLKLLVDLVQCQRLCNVLCTSDDVEKKKQKDMKEKR